MTKLYHTKQDVMPPHQNVKMSHTRDCLNNILKNQTTGNHQSENLFSSACLRKPLSQYFENNTVHPDLTIITLFRFCFFSFWLAKSAFEN